MSAAEEGRGEDNPGFTREPEDAVGPGGGRERQHDDSDIRPYDDAEDGEDAAVASGQKQHKRGPRRGSSSAGSSTTSAESYHPRDSGRAQKPAPDDVELTKIGPRSDGPTEGPPHTSVIMPPQPHTHTKDGNVGASTSHNGPTMSPDHAEGSPELNGGRRSPGGMYCHYRDVSTQWCSKHSRPICFALLAIAAILYVAWLIAAIWISWHESDPYFVNVRFVFAMTVAAAVITSLRILIRYLGPAVHERVIKPVVQYYEGKHTLQTTVRVLLILVVAVGIAVFLGADTAKRDINRLVSLVGLLLFVLFGYLFSKHPAHVQWRPVIWGLAMQFLLGVFVLRWKFGKQVFEWLGDRVTYILRFSDRSAEFVFGKGIVELGPFAFKVLMVVIFFSSLIQILYYLEVMQAIVSKIAWVMQKTMKTTAAESLNAAANIFVGQTEAPIMIKPYLPLMTLSELHAIMTGGFATVAGGVLAIYIQFGVKAEHLISASVMSAPAALAMSKLMYPETEESKTRTEEDVANIAKPTEYNVIEAAANGASQAVTLVANIGANLIAFLAILYLLDAASVWFFGMVGEPWITFQIILGWLFTPVALIMGVAWEDAFKVGELLGIKTFFNEFIGYEKLVALIRAGELQERSEIIAIYALCGFSNFGSIGVQLGGLGAMAPGRKSDMATIALRAMIAGSVACFMTACVAGILTEEARDVISGGSLGASLNMNMTTTTTAVPTS